MTQTQTVKTLAISDYTRYEENPTDSIPAKDFVATSNSEASYMQSSLPEQKEHQKKSLLKPITINKGANLISSTTSPNKRQYTPVPLSKNPYQRKKKIYHGKVKETQVDKRKLLGAKNSYLLREVADWTVEDVLY